MAEPLPRFTRFWAKQAKMLTALDIEAFSDRGLQLRLIRTVELLAASLGMVLGNMGEEDEAALAGIRRPDETLEISLDALVSLYVQRSPMAAHAFSPADLKQWLGWRVEWELRYAAGEDAQTLIEEAKERGPKRLARLLPDNPVEVQPDGDLRFYQDANDKHRYQLRDYFRSLRPAARRGRPRKETAPRRTSWAPLDVARAQQAARMKDDGAEWTAIASALVPGFNPADYNPRTRDKARKRVSRLVERGRLDRDRPQPS